MRIRSLATAVPLLLAATLAATAPGASQAADDDPHGPGTGKPQVSGKLAAVAPCRGGKQKRAFSGGHADWFGTESTAAVPGTEYLFRGPKKRKDTVFVTFTAPNTYATSNDYGRVRVTLDGATMRPNTVNNEYFYASTNYSSFAGQYCAKVGKGLHKVEVFLDSFGTDDTAYLVNPMVHVEVAE